MLKHTQFRSKCSYDHIADPFWNAGNTVYVTHFKNLFCDYQEPNWIMGQLL